MKNSVAHKKHKLRISIAHTAVLSAFLLACLVLWCNTSPPSPETVGAREAAVREIVRIVGSEMACARSRDQAFYCAFVDSGGEEDAYGEADHGVELDILSISEDTVSFAVETSLPDSSPYGRIGYYNVDQLTGEHLTLEDIIGEGWREYVWERVLPQIYADPQVYTGVDVLPMINRDRMFYLDPSGDSAVIVFDTGEIAPDFAGVKKYRISLTEESFN